MTLATTIFEEVALRDSANMILLKKKKKIVGTKNPKQKPVKHSEMMRRTRMMRERIALVIIKRQKS